MPDETDRVRALEDPEADGVEPLPIFWLDAEGDDA